MNFPAIAMLAVQRAGLESRLIIPDLSAYLFLGVDGERLLLAGLQICLVGIAFGLYSTYRISLEPVHAAMGSVAALVYATCRAYLVSQLRFVLMLAGLTAVVIAVYFGILRGYPASTVALILVSSLVGIAGSLGLAWFGIRVNTLANSRAAFASLRGRPFPTLAIPLRAGISIGTMLISIELLLLIGIVIFLPRDLAAACLIGFAIGESLGASVLRIAGGIFTKIADIGADLMKIVFDMPEDDPRNPGVIADCVGDNAGDSVGPTADGFESYGVTIVALITFILLGVPAVEVQVRLLVWLFVIAVLTLVASLAAYVVNDVFNRVRNSSRTTMDFEKPLNTLVWVTSLTAVTFTWIGTYLLIPELGDGTVWWQLAAIVSCGMFAAAAVPQLVQVFTSTRSSHVREVVAASRQGGAPLNILAGLVSGNFSAFWLGLQVAGLMGVVAMISTLGLEGIVPAAPIFALGLLAFGFLGMAPVTIAVDSYGPVTDNAQSIFELSGIESMPGMAEEIHRDFGFEPDFRRAKHLLEENDGAGNTFKATAKPVLIATAVIGATTMIFSIIFLLTNGLTAGLERLSILHPPFLIGLVLGGAVVYWFTGAATQAVSSGAYRAVEFIQENIRVGGTEVASREDSARVVEICTQFAQKGMLNIFLAVFFLTLGLACIEPFLFVGYLISIAIFGLYQAVFLANAGGAWDNAKKIVEVELRERGTPLHAAMVVGDTVGDPFKDTASVALNPIIKFTTLFGLLTVELAIDLPRMTSMVAAAVFLVIGLHFVWRSFYRMKIGEPVAPVRPAAPRRRKRERVLAPGA